MVKESALGTWLHGLPRHSFDGPTNNTFAATDEYGESILILLTPYFLGLLVLAVGFLVYFCSAACECHRKKTALGRSCFRAWQIVAFLVIPALCIGAAVSGFVVNETIEGAVDDFVHIVTNASAQIASNSSKLAADLEAYGLADQLPDLSAMVGAAEQASNASQAAGRDIRQGEQYRWWGTVAGLAAALCLSLCGALACLLPRRLVFHLTALLAFPAMIVLVASATLEVGTAIVASDICPSMTQLVNASLSRDQAEGFQYFVDCQGGSTISQALTLLNTTKTGINREIAKLEAQNPVDYAKIAELKAELAVLDQAQHNAMVLMNCTITEEAYKAASHQLCYNLIDGFLALSAAQCGAVLCLALMLSFSRCLWHRFPQPDSPEAVALLQQADGPGSVGGSINQEEPPLDPDQPLPAFQEYVPPPAISPEH